MRLFLVKNIFQFGSGNGQSYKRNNKLPLFCLFFLVRSFWPFYFSKISVSFAKDINVVSISLSPSRLNVCFPLPFSSSFTSFLSISLKLFQAYISFAANFFASPIHLFILTSSVYSGLTLSPLVLSNCGTFYPHNVASLFFSFHFPIAHRISSGPSYFPCPIIFSLSEARYFAFPKKFYLPLPQTLYFLFRPRKLNQ